MVEDQGGGKAQSGRGVEAVAEFDGHQRIEAECLERTVVVHGVVGGVAEYFGDVGAHQIQDHALTVGCGQLREPLGEGGVAPGAGCGTPSYGGRQTA